ncbi:hypothetical protein B0A53_01285 [Rhodotorula sp. CCFEE 5036]|nr:hypothetical protein B0A53_01285 [Rhodotorula sp. CCFEE 5036]
MKLAAALVVSLLAAAQLVSGTPSDKLKARRAHAQVKARQYGGYGGAYGGAAPAAAGYPAGSPYAPSAMSSSGTSMSGMDAGSAAPATNMSGTPCSGMADSMSMAGMASMSYGVGWPAASSAPSSNNDTGLVPGPGQVVVAPKQGDLRFVPFNINVKPGQNVSFIWGAGPHTVTQSSALSICNATQQPGAFKSGMQNAGFEFSVPVKDESTIYYFCGVPSHCQKGMFGLINGAVADHPSDSFGNFLDQWGAMNPDNQVLINITIQITASVPLAAKWGSSLSMSQLEPWAVDWAMQQTLYTRQFFAQNPELLAADVNGTTTSTITSSSATTAQQTSAAVPTGSTSASSSAAIVRSSGPTAIAAAAACAALVATVFLSLA